MTPRAVAQAFAGRHRRQPGLVDPISQGGSPWQPPLRTVDERHQLVQPWGKPLVDPIEAPPAVDSPVEAGEMLAIAVHGLPMGRADRALLASAERHWPPAQIAILAGLIFRARAAGPAVGVR